MLSVSSLNVGKCTILLGLLLFTLFNGVPSITVYNFLFFDSELVYVLEIFYLFDIHLNLSQVHVIFFGPLIEDIEVLVTMWCLVTLSLCSLANVIVINVNILIKGFEVAKFPSMWRLRNRFLVLRWFTLAELINKVYH